MDDMTVSEIFKRDPEFIGYFAETLSGKIFTPRGGRILIGSSEEKMMKYIVSPKNGEQITIKATNFNLLVNNFANGCSFEFDVDSYIKFERIARSKGINSLPDPNDRPNSDNVFFYIDHGKFTDLKNIH